MEPRGSISAPNGGHQMAGTTTTHHHSQGGCCDATSFYLGATLFLSLGSALCLLLAFLSDHWELVLYDGEHVASLARQRGMALTRSRNVLRLADGGGVGGVQQPSPLQRESALFLVNLNGGVHRICATLDGDDLAFLGNEAKGAPGGCISYYSSSDEERISTLVVRSPWLDKMKNLAMSCSLVSLILVGASALVGGFGICKRQLSAVMVTGVMFILAAVFATFTSCFMHFKRTVPQGVLTGTDFDQSLPSEFLRCRRFARDWAASLSWLGIALCLFTSVFWLILARIMRF
ncbi:uncharacterized protein [Dermacentor andersoni]|uniref:uncharacterized protein n=1 Tax=Dermacentor andersoni TaxID=34620 RepID=UPI002155AB7C|nr:uncharacterized protein LOC126525569 [Dermacentor andersoni]XP_054923720.1 uncharacterized protein LOC126525569 [Dermacentor andersoni]